MWLANWSGTDADGKETETTWNEARHDKTNKVTVRPAKTQISLGIRPVHIEKTSSLPAATCEQNFILNGIVKLYLFYNIFLSIRASIPVRTVL